MREISYLEAVREAMTQEMERDEKVFLIGEDIGQYGGAFGASFGMLEQFGEDRILDTPITELGLTGAATGAALVGMRPIAEIMFMDFTTLASEQLVNRRPNCVSCLAVRLPCLWFCARRAGRAQVRLSTIHRAWKTGLYIFPA